MRPYPHSQHAFVSIDGIGGIGKSSLALEVAHRYLEESANRPEDERFKAIIWTSAKQTKLTAEGIQPRYQSHRTLEDIYTAIAVTLQREDIMNAEPSRQTELLRNALTRQRTLLVIDNLETIDDEAVVNFIREIPAPTKAIVTTRHRIDVTYAVRLTGMKPEDAQALIRQECAVRDISLTEDQGERLFGRTGGVPLAIVWTLAKMGFGHPPETVLLRLGEPQTDIIRFCFDESISLIKKKPAERLLIALSYFAGSASREGLGAVADLPVLDRDEGLVDLEKLSLVNKAGNRFSFLPVTKVMAADLAIRDQEKYLEYGKRWLSYLRSLHSSPAYTADYRLHYGRYLSWEDAPSFLEAVDWAYEYGTASDVFSMTILSIDYLDVMGRWNLLLELLQRAYELARTVQNQRAIAYSAQFQGWLLEQEGEFEQAMRYYKESLGLYRQDGDNESAAVVLCRCSAVMRKRGSFSAARQYLDEARVIAEQLGEGDLRALVDTEDGKLHRDLGNWDESWFYFSRVRDYFAHRTEEAPADDQLAIGTYGHLAFVAYRLGRIQEAKELCLRSIAYFSESGSKGYLATLKYRLGLIEEALGEFDGAEQHVTEALYWFDHLGMKPDIPAALELKARLESQ